MKKTSKSFIKNIKEDTPFYPISMAAQLIGISPDRLRTYEEENLIKPYRNDKGKRLFSQNDINYLICLRKFIREYGISIKGLNLLLEFTTCNEIMHRVCPENNCIKCIINTDYKNNK